MDLFSTLDACFFAQRKAHVMTLHIFNPEHDIALASGLANFTSPHAGRQMRNDLSFLPAIWAREDDAVWVNDVEQAEVAWRRLFRGREHAEWIERKKLPKLPITGVAPWGWDAALRGQLVRGGVAESIVPSVQQIGMLREQSHRRTSRKLLEALQGQSRTGQMVECFSASEVDEWLSEWKQVVVKSPWSSSGRGVRFLCNERSLHGNEQMLGWMNNVIRQQGSVMVEPYYNKVKDFGMEFVSAGGRVEFLGLSLFHTVNGAYTGNIVAPEKVKRELLHRFVSEELLESVETTICTSEIFKDYEGYFGVDMMILPNQEEDGGGFVLHPCVEVNMRRTMGHVAIALNALLNPVDDDELSHVMRIEYTGKNYKLKINRL